MKKWISIGAGIFFLSSNAICGEEAKIELKLKIQGVRDNAGKICVGLYNEKSGFGKKAESPADGRCESAVVGDMEFLFQVPPGWLAVQALHDRNENKKMDFKYFVIPMEGFGLSNNPTLKGPPDFEMVKFMPKAGDAVLIKMDYSYAD